MHESGTDVSTLELGGNQIALDVRTGEMGSEKSQALYVPTDDSYEGKSLKDKGNKYCTKYVLYWVLGSFLIALVVGLCVQFLFPVVDRRYKTVGIETVRVDLAAKPVSTNHPFDVKSEDSKDDANLPWHLDFLINPTRLCDSWDDPQSEAYQNNPEVKLLVLVPSATSHFTHRMTIRKTWGAVAVKPHGPMRLGFVLGTTSNSTEEELIRHESEIYGDVIQADFADTYRNLTAKSVLMLKWVSRYCSHAQYFLKTDDDTFVNLPVLSRVLQKPVYDPREKFVAGFVQRGAVPTRTPTEKYYVSEDDFSEEEYPPYASGSAYVTTGPTAAQLYDASRRVTPVLPMEDVFVTGLCADDINAALLHEPTFRYTTPEEGSSWESFSSLATAHSVTPSEMDLVWEQMTKALLEALNFSDSSSSSDSWDSFGSISMSDLFGWSDEDQQIFGDESSDFDSSMSGSDNMKTSGIKSIFDIFNMLKNQVETNGDLKELDPSPLNANGKPRSFIFGGNPLIEEPLALPSKQQTNKGNFLLNEDVQKKINDTLSQLKSDSSGSSYLFYFK